VIHPHYHPDGGDNVLGYDNPEVKKWIEEAMSEPDREKRRDLYLKISWQVLEDIPWIILWAEHQHVAMQKYVMNFDHVAIDGFKDLIWTTWLDKA
jgi:ABC-type transport system substrate-binding protein